LTKVNRLRHHPSILVWAGNNENEAAVSTNWYGTDIDKELYANDYRTLYINLIMTTIQNIESNMSRPFISSSPTNGKATRLENWLAKNPYDWK
jgi:beta-mannosidase